MINITITQLQNDIVSKMKGTSLREIADIFVVASTAANRMLSRIDTEETRRTVTLATPFWDNIQDYACPTDFKRMIDIRPQANRSTQPGLSNFTQTSPRQFSERLDPNSFSIKWNNFVRTLQAQRLPAGGVALLDSFDSITGNGTWTAEGDASGLYIESLNFVQGSSSLGMNLSGATGAADIVNSTAPVTDLSALRYQDASAMYVWIPSGYSARFTSFALTRGSSASAYKKATVTTKGDGTAFTDGWNLLLFFWNQATTTGVPDDTKNTYRKLNVAYTAGVAINGFLVDSWTDSLGNLYEVEYYSECLFRTSAGAWINKPTAITDLLNVSPASYEILKTEMMVDITQDIRTGAVRAAELADWRLMLNGQSQSRYVKDPPYHGLYADYTTKYPSYALSPITKYYDFDL